MFEKKDETNLKVTVKIYPGGSFLGTKSETFNFKKGEKEDEKYKKLQEEFKAVSIKAQSDTTETESLTDDTLKVTYMLGGYAFTINCESVMPSIDHIKALTKMNEEELDYIDKYYRTRENFDTFPTTVEFEKLIVGAMESTGQDIGILDKHYEVTIKLHDSYTESHKNSIEYIVHKFVGNVYTKKDGVIEFGSDDLELKQVLLDLSMCQYYDIDVRG